MVEHTQNTTKSIMETQISKFVPEGHEEEQRRFFSAPSSTDIRNTNRPAQNHGVRQRRATAQKESDEDGALFERRRCESIAEAENMANYSCETATNSKEFEHLGDDPPVAECDAQTEDEPSDHKSLVTENLVHKTIHEKCSESPQSNGTETTRLKSTAVDKTKIDGRELSSPCNAPHTNYETATTRPTTENLILDANVSQAKRVEQTNTEARSSNADGSVTPNDRLWEYGDQGPRSSLYYTGTTPEAAETRCNFHASSSGNSDFQGKIQEHQRPSRCLKSPDSKTGASDSLQAISSEPLESQLEVSGEGKQFSNANRISLHPVPPVAEDLLPDINTEPSELSPSNEGASNDLTEVKVSYSVKRRKRRKGRRREPDGQENLANVETERPSGERVNNDDAAANPDNVRLPVEAEDSGLLAANLPHIQSEVAISRTATYESPASTEGSLRPTAHSLPDLTFIPREYWGSRPLQSPIEETLILKIPGKVVIINNIDFDNLTRRNGSEKDEDMIKELFKKKGWHDIEEHRNKTTDEMKRTLNEVFHKLASKQCSCLVIFVLTHGQMNGSDPCVCGSDGGYVSLSSLLETRQKHMCPTLWFIQACKSEKELNLTKTEAEPLQLDLGEAASGTFEAASETLYCPGKYNNFNNCLLFSACQPGENAIRHVNDGSVFIWCFTQRLLQSGHQLHIEELCTLVRTWVKHYAENHEYKQTPCINSHLNSRLILFPS